MKTALLIALLFPTLVLAQSAQVGGTTRIQGDITINATSKNMTAVATGSNTVAKNSIGSVKGDVRQDMKITATANNVTTVASGRNRKACTNIGGVVKEECK